MIVDYVCIRLHPSLVLLSRCKGGIGGLAIYGQDAGEKLLAYRGVQARPCAAMVASLGEKIGFDVCDLGSGGTMGKLQHLLVEDCAICPHDCKSTRYIMFHGAIKRDLCSKVFVKLNNPQVKLFVS